MTVAVIGVDPGLSTGIGEIMGGRRRMVFQGPPRDALDALEQLLIEHGRDGHETLVAVEQFQAAGRRAHTVQPEAQETVSRAKVLSETYGVRCVLQPPGDAKRIAPDLFLRKAGLWVMPREVSQSDAHDANDAMRHAVLALARYHATLYESIVAYTEASRTILT